MWDNSAVLHRADHSDVIGDRVMHRGMVATYSGAPAMSGLLRGPVSAVDSDGARGVATSYAHARGVLDHPTGGVDVGARGEMHDLIRRMSRAGRIVLLASSDPDEYISVCDRVAVLRRGRQPRRARTAITEPLSRT